jgi:hypothetical protein
MDSLFPDNKQDEKALFKAFELIEKEKAETLLREHGISRPGKVIQHDFRKKSNAWWMAAAVLLLVAGALYYIVTLQLPGAQQLADSALTTVMDDYNFTVRSSNAAEALSEVQISINNGEYNVAIQQLNTAIQNTAASDTLAIVNLHFYSGIVFLQKNNFSTAIQHFNAVINYQNNSLYRDAVWLRGLAHLKAGNKAAAIKDLEETSKQTNWVKSEEAKKMLESLEHN